MKILHLNKYYRESVHNFNRYHNLYRHMVLNINRTNMTITLSTDIQLIFRNIEKEEDVVKLIGYSVNLIVYDDDLPKEICEYLNYRIVR